MADRFHPSADTIGAPSRRALAVALSDTVALSELPKALWVGTGGNLTVKLGDDSTAVVLKNVPSGSIVPVRATYVMLATTALDIVALY